MRLKTIFILLSFIWINTVSEANANPLADVFERVSPSVVVILVSSHAPSKKDPKELVFEKGLGSGVVISKDGLIMTAAHVVQVADEVSVMFSDGHKETAKVLNTNIATDVALIKMDKVSKKLVVAEMGDSDSVRIGEDVFVIGAPYGMEYTLTVGHISGRRTTKEVSSQLVPIEFLQTDAAVNQGNSGGPMFNMNGEIIGIVSHSLSQSGGFEGLGFASSINTAKEMLLKRKSFWSGVEFALLTGDLAKALNVPQNAGLLIQVVAVGSPGYKMGLKAGKIPVRIGENEVFIGGDIVFEIMGRTVSEDVESLLKIQRLISDLAPGGTIKIKVLRGGNVIELSVSKQ